MHDTSPDAKAGSTACSDVAGQYAPVVDRNKCEGKAECVRVCPYSVFRIQVLGSEDKSALSLRGRLKAWAHGGKQAFVINPGACHACKLCVQACPENALALAPVAVNTKP